MRHLFCDAFALGPRGLGDEGVLLCLGVALTGLNFNGRLGSTTGTAPASLLGVVSLSGRFGTALAGVALLCTSLLCRLGPSSHGLP